MVEHIHECSRCKKEFICFDESCSGKNGKYRCIGHCPICIKNSICDAYGKRILKVSKRIAKFIGGKEVCQ